MDKDDKKGLDGRLSTLISMYIQDFSKHIKITTKGRTCSDIGYDLAIILGYSTTPISSPEVLELLHEKYGSVAKYFTIRTLFNNSLMGMMSDVPATKKYAEKEKELRDYLTTKDFPPQMRAVVSNALSSLQNPRKSVKVRNRIAELFSENKLLDALIKELKPNK